MIVRLPGNRLIAVDAKAPLAGYLAALEATSDTEREDHLARHARDLRSHVRTLAARDYALGLGSEVDLVVLFLPGDPFLGAAFARDPEIQVEALRSRVLIATPTTLVALLRTVAIYWQQRSLAENAEQIAEIARELYDRATVFSEHLARMGKGLAGAVEAYNSAVGSFERRLLPLSRQLESLKVAEQSKRQMEHPALLGELPREPR
jgi:DNA recombination protein RmuC